ncbi:hypothetical protein AVEN_259050-1 [Araneus ventricosus]|uniref:Uncharacterized protein n=1 Tax=Araneus ventricosus TaxID=182803 RepID=A0A4Y2T2J4_ARAVE|nr:hypothetical protein AVEN_259050-1 [Araneus ventricosus]
MSSLSWEALLDCMKTTLKTHCDTRWSSRRQAVTALQKNLPSVHKENATLDIELSLLSGLSKNIKHLRDKAVHNLRDEAAKVKTVCDSMPIRSSFTVKGLRKVKKMAGEMAEYEAHLICAEKSFELECFKVYDRLISEIKSRSDIYHTAFSDFSFLSGKALIESSVSYFEKCAADFGAKYNKNIENLELVNEVSTFKFQVKELVKNISTASHLDILKVILKYGLRNVYPNIEIALRIFMAMPTTLHCYWCRDTFFHAEFSLASHNARGYALAD